MKKFATIVFALALVVGCKKEDAAKKPEPAKTDPKAVDKGGPDKMGAAPDKGGATAPDKGGATTPDKGGDAIVFPTKPLQAGDVDDGEETMDMTMNIKVTVEGQAHDMTVAQSEDKKTKVEVQASNDEFVTKEKLTVVSDIQTETKPMKPPGTPTPTAISGKSYVLEAKGADVTITDDKGAAVPEDEAKLVKKAANHFGKADPMDAVLKGQKFVVGQKVSIPADKLAGMFGDDDAKTTLSSASFTLTKNEGGIATLDVEMTMNVDQGPMSMSIPMKGTGRVEIATGHSLELSMEGPITVKGQDPKMPMEGSGTVKMHQVHTFGK